MAIRNDEIDSIIHDLAKWARINMLNTRDGREEINRILDRIGALKQGE